MLKSAVVVGPYEQMVKGSKNIHRVIIYGTVVSAIPLKRIDEAEQICGEVVNELLTAEGLDFLLLLSTACLFWNKGVGAA